MRLGVVILPEHPWATARDIWRRAEDLGFDHAWTYDHLAWRSLRDTTWFGAIPTLTAAAGVDRTHPARPAGRVAELPPSGAVREGADLARRHLGRAAHARDRIGRRRLGRDRARRRAVVAARADRALRRVRRPHRPAAARAGDVVPRPLLLGRRRAHLSRLRATAARAVRGRGHGPARDAARRGATPTRGSRPAQPRDRRARCRPTRAPPSCARRWTCSTTRAPRSAAIPASLARLVLSGISLDSGLASAGAFDETIGAYADGGRHRLRRALAPRRPSRSPATSRAFERIVSRSRT